MSDTELDPTLPADAEPTTDGNAEIQTQDAEKKGEDKGSSAAESDGLPKAEGDAAEPAAQEPVEAAAADGADENADGAAPLTAPDADEVSAQADADLAEGKDKADADAEPAPIADDGNVVAPEAIQPPLAEASSIAPALPSASTGPDSGAAGDEAHESEAGGEGDKPAEPVPATPAPLDSIRAGAQGAASGDADPSAGIVPQPSPEDALAERPLSGIASEENRGAVDAMPAAAQQHMGQWIKGVHEAEPAEAGQLPTTADLPGTCMDATGVGTYPKGGVTAADKAIEGEDEGGAEGAQDAQEGDADAQGDSDVASGADDADAADGDDLDADFNGAANDDDSDSAAYFGEVLVQHGPLKDVAGDAIDALKEAAEQAAVAQNHFQNVPLAVLDLQHKDLLSDMRVVLGDLLRLSARLFERLER